MSLEAFIKEHGDFVIYKAHAYHLDGTVRENDRNFVYQMTVDPFDRAKNIRIYWAVKRDRAKQAFHQHKHLLKQGAHYASIGVGQEPPQAEIDRLVQLQQAFKELDAKWLAANAEVDRLDPRREQREYEAQRRSQVAADMAILGNQIDTINI